MPCQQVSGEGRDEAGRQHGLGVNKQRRRDVRRKENQQDDAQRLHLTHATGLLLAGCLLRSRRRMGEDPDKW